MKNQATQPRPIDAIVAFGVLAAIAIFVGIVFLLALWIASGVK